MENILHPYIVKGGLGMSWKFLSEGDIVDLIAPGSPSNPHDIESALKLITSWGLKPRFQRSFKKYKLPYLTGSDEDRFLEFKTAIYAKDSKLVWCLRGGYGSLRILPHLCRLKKPKESKLVLGYSDITTLHSFLNDKWNWVSCHGPLLESLVSGRMSSKDINMVKDILFGHKSEFNIGLRALNRVAKKQKKPIRGILSGGNLTVVNSHIGTQINPSFRSKIVFFEDIGERGYRLDRMLTQLSFSGAFSGCQSLVFGDFNGGYESSGKSLVWRTLKEWAENQKFPVYYKLPVGHGTKNHCLFLNKKVCIESSRLKFSSGVKS